jgi:hypothetical protein
MAKTSRVVINRKAVDGVTLAVADGAFAVAKAHNKATHPPDAPPYGQGLVQGGGALVFVDGKKVDGTTIGGRQIKKPRQLNTKDHTVVAVSGWGFPGRLVQFGTTDTPAQPFFKMSTIQARAKGIFEQAAKYRIVRLGRA